MNDCDTLIIGVAQCIALVPGISRAGATMSAGLLREITQFRRLIKPGGLALIYYAGYAVDASGGGGEPLHRRTRASVPGAGLMRSPDEPAHAPRLEL